MVTWTNSLNPHLNVNIRHMSKANLENNGEIREYYDFSKGVRGKYADRFAKGSNVVVLEPDVAKAFPDSESVNRALRKFVTQQAGT